GSQSTVSTRRPRSARAAARLMAVVVLPTPPFPDTQAIPMPMLTSRGADVTSPYLGRIRSRQASNSPRRILPATAVWPRHWQPGAGEWRPDRYAPATRHLSEWLEALRIIAPR